MRARRARHAYEYARYGLDDTHFDKLLHALDAYRAHRRAIPSAIVHGDPVFTNVLVTARDDDADERSESDSALKLIDMRGMQGDRRSLEGDAVYDLAKVLQSVLGYDFILSDVPVTHAVARRLSGYVRAYWDSVWRTYGNLVQMSDVLVVCASLWTSLIPLHHDSEQPQRARRSVVTTRNGLVHNPSRKELFACVAKIVLDAALSAQRAPRNQPLQAQIDRVANVPFEMARAFERL